MIIDLWINWYRDKKPIPQKSVFSTAYFQSEKNLQFGSFFLRTTTFGHNTFWIALHVIKMDNFNCFNTKYLRKIISLVLWVNNIANYLEI